MTIIVSIVITGLIIAMSSIAGTQAQMTGSLSKMDQAFYAAEAGAHHVAWYCKNDKMASITSPLTGTVNGYAYSAAWTIISGTTIAITSTASLGNVSYVCHLTVIPPPLMLPVFATGADFDNKNINLTGDLQTGGNYSNGGSGSLNGNLVYTGTATNTSNVSGSKATGPFYTLDMTALDKVLAPNIVHSYPGSQVGTTFNFNLYAGTNKVIYVDGNVTNPTFVGAGTLYVNGNISAGSFGSAASPVNLVATGDITTGGNSTIYGCLYATGSWYRAKMDLTGLVYVNGISPANAGSSSMTQTGAPWFDPRIDAAGKALSHFNNFSGPLP
jgi:hypothetical protein